MTPLFVLIGISSALGAPPLSTVIASKPFPESYILAEIAAIAIQSAGETEIRRKFGLGATGIVFQAIQSEEIALYPEYTGTIAEAFLRDSSLKSVDSIREPLEKLGLTVSEPLGFNNTYALSVRRDFAEKHGLKTISDLAHVREARYGLTNEIMNRKDGYPGLARRYGLRPLNLRELQHTLAYQALENGEIDVTDVYSTDASIRRLDLVVLEDDLGYFPAYQAVYLARKVWTTQFPKSWAALNGLAGRISQDRMISLNALVEIEKRSFAEAARSFFEGATIERTPTAFWKPLWLRTLQHLRLVTISLASSILVGLPLGILAFLRPTLRVGILNLIGLVQTIPSLALLAFLIPLFGIGERPAIVALFLYGLLPVALNTFTGLEGIDPRLHESARGLGLDRRHTMTRVLLPLASPSILAGIRTSAVIGIGTATLAALIGAGGYGAPIMTGLALNDIPTLLQGAIPAAMMALLVQFLFDRISQHLIPEGLRRDQL